MTTNVLSLAQLEEAFKKTVSDFGAQIFDGIQDGRVKREDGYPWLSVHGGSLSFKTAEDFAQALADSMRCRVYLNNATQDGVEAVMDFDTDRLDAGGALLSLFETDPEIAEYGQLFEPRPIALAATPKKTAP